MRFRLLAAVLPLFAVLLSACGGGQDSSAPSKPMAVITQTSSGPITVGTTLTFTSVDSGDARGNTLFHRAWTLSNQPQGSTAAIQGIVGSALAPTPTAETAVLVPDLPGEYVIQLIVHTGDTASAPTRLAVNVSAVLANRAPVASINGLTAGQAGQSALLDGSGTTDPDGDTVTLDWQLSVKPNGSQATLTATGRQATFLPDLTGDYEVVLVASDGKATSTAVHRFNASAMPALALTSTSFPDQGVIPLRYVALQKGGNNVSPALQIQNVPASTQFLAILMDDESPPCGTGAQACVHWGGFNLPATKVTFAEGETLTGISGVVTGRNLDNVQAYLGPRPPNDGHVYRFTVYALGSAAPLVPASPIPYYRRSQFEAIYATHILGKSTWTGRYPN